MRQTAAKADAAGNQSLLGQVQRCQRRIHTSMSPFVPGQLRFDERFNSKDRRNGPHGHAVEAWSPEMVRPAPVFAFSMRTL